MIRNLLAGLALWLWSRGAARSAQRAAEAALDLSERIDHAQADTPAGADAARRRLRARARAD